MGEQVGIQEILVWLPGAQAKPWQVREPLDRDLVRDLDAELKILRHVRNHASQIPVVGEFVIGGIDADRFEDFGVFGQAIPVETTL